MAYSVHVYQQSATEFYKKHKWHSLIEAENKKGLLRHTFIECCCVTWFLYLEALVTDSQTINIERGCILKIKIYDRNNPLNVRCMFVLIMFMWTHCSSWITVTIEKSEEVKKVHWLVKQHYQEQMLAWVLRQPDWLQTLGLRYKNEHYLFPIWKLVSVTS